MVAASGEGGIEMRQPRAYTRLGKKGRDAAMLRHRELSCAIALVLVALVVALIPSCSSGLEAYTFRYDDAGRLTMLQAPGGDRVFYQHDKAGRLISFGTRRQSYRLEYGPLGECTEILLPSGAAVTIKWAPLPSVDVAARPAQSRAVGPAATCRPIYVGLALCGETKSEQTYETIGRELVAGWSEVVGYQTVMALADPDWSAAGMLQSMGLTAVRAGLDAARLNYAQRTGDTFSHLRALNDLLEQNARLSIRAANAPGSAVSRAFWIATAAAANYCRGDTSRLYFQYSANNWHQGSLIGKFKAAGHWALGLVVSPFDAAVRAVKRFVASVSETFDATYSLSRRAVGLADASLFVGELVSQVDAIGRARMPGREGAAAAQATKSTRWTGLPAGRDMALEVGAGTAGAIASETAMMALRRQGEAGATAARAEDSPLPSWARCPASDPAVSPGGIMLDTAARVDTPVNDVEAVVWDKDTNSLVLIGRYRRTLPRLPPDWLAVAIKCVRAGGGPGFSLDPADPSNPTGPWQVCRYIGPIEHTGVGLHLYEADWLMKRWAMGKDRPRLRPALSSIFDLSWRRGTTAASAIYRFWIVCKRADVVDAGDGLRFKRVQMEVLTENMFRTRQGLQSSGGQQDPIARAYAAQLTRRYDEIANVVPSFAKVKQIAKCVAIARWIEQHDWPIDEAWLEKACSKKVETPKRKPTQRASQTRQHGIIIETLTLIGGVDLDFEPKTIARGPDELVEQWKKFRPAWLGRKELGNMRLPGGRIATIYLIGKDSPRLLAAAREHSPYRFDNQGRLVEAVNVAGRPITYEYREDSAELVAVRSSTPDNKRLRLAKRGGRWQLAIDGPRGEDRLDFEYDPGGLLSTIKFNGQPLSQWQWSPDGEEVSVAHDGLRKTVKLGEHGNFQVKEEITLGIGASRPQEIASIEIGREEAGTRATGRSIVGEFEVRFDSTGRPTEGRIGGRHATVTYAASGDRVESISFKDGPQLRITAGEQPGEQIIECRIGETTIRIARLHGRVTWWTDGESTVRCRYGKDGRLLSLRCTNGARMSLSYDKSGRLSRIVLRGDKAKGAQPRAALPSVAATALMTAGLLPVSRQELLN